MSGAVIELREVSKWYGEVLGVNRITLDVQPGITSLVGPNGAGKSTFMGLVCGLLRPSKGSVSVLGIPSTEPQDLHRVLGTCPQHDTFHDTLTGDEVVVGLLRVGGIPAPRARALAGAALDRVGLAPEARGRRIGSYSKGMRQRLKLALALAHEPPVLLLDEPLDGLDPLARNDSMALFRELARDGATVVISSHVLHEVDALADAVVMLHHGYVVAEGGIRDVRQEISNRPHSVFVACDAPQRLAARAFDESLVVGARVEGRGVFLHTFEPRALAALVGAMAARGDVEVTAMDLADENVQAVYDYLIGADEVGS